MALPASMTSPLGLGTTSVLDSMSGSGSRSVTRSESGSGLGSDRLSVSDGFVGVEMMKGSGSMTEENTSGIDSYITDQNRVEMDDDEVLRILSAFDDDEDESESGSESESESDGSENDTDTVTGDGSRSLGQGVGVDVGVGVGVGQGVDLELGPGEWDDKFQDEVQGPSNPSRYLSQRLKGVYSSGRGGGGSGSGGRGGGGGRGSGRGGRGSGRGGGRGEDIFEDVDSKSRVRDIRKSSLSLPPPLVKVPVKSLPLTPESRTNSPFRDEKDNDIFRDSRLGPGSITVAGALAALKERPNTLRNIPQNKDSPQNVPKGAVFTTNTGLRALAENPVMNGHGGVTAYVGEEVGRALR